jgi:spore germination protein KC
VIRRIMILLLAVLVAQPLVGCWSRVEINELAIVSMIAIDQLEDGNIKLWIHVVIPARAGAAPGGSGGGSGGGGGGDSSPYITLSSKGLTVMEASRQIQLELPRRLFWAHARVTLIGERLARAGVGQVLDFFTRHRELRLSDYLLVVPGDVGKVMSTTVDLEKLPVEYIRKVTRSRIGVMITIGDFAKTLAGKGADPIMGVVVVQPPPEGAPPTQKPGLKLAGTALFREDKLVGFMDDSLTRGLLWLRNEVQRAVITMKVPKTPGYVSVEWVSSHVKRTVRVEGGNIVLYLAVRTVGDIGEESAHLDLSDPKMLAKVQGLFSEDVRERMETALAKLQESSVDAAGFGETIHRQLPAVWKGVEQRWLREEFQRTKIVITVDARLRRTGLSGKPRGVKEEDLIKGE